MESGEPSCKVYGGQVTGGNIQGNVTAWVPLGMYDVYLHYRRVDFFIEYPQNAILKYHKLF